MICGDHPIHSTDCHKVQWNLSRFWEDLPFSLEVKGCPLTPLWNSYPFLRGSLFWRFHIAQDFGIIVKYGGLAGIKSPVHHLDHGCILGD